MPTDLNRDTMERLARLGAMRRIEELRQEEAAIRAAFPELFQAGRRGRPRAAASASATAAPAEAAAPGKRRRRRRQVQMSPAARRAVSIRMKKYWAERRKAKNG